MRPQSASVAFKGGGVVLSAQTPYDREVLVDYVRDCARAKEDVRLVVGRATWRIERVYARHPLVCPQCHRPLRDARCCGPQSGQVECVNCALSEARGPGVGSSGHG